jgi:hypothetical protein
MLVHGFDEFGEADPVGTLNMTKAMSAPTIATARVVRRPRTFATEPM